MSSHLHRTFAALSALWFAILMVASPLAHTCELHDAVTSADASSETHGGHGTADTTGVPDDDACEHCTCIGDCTGAAFAAPLRAPDGLAVIPASVVRAAAPHAFAPAPGAPDVLLPFALGPPLLA